MKKIKIEVEISDELHDLIERLATFLRVDPQTIIKDRALTHLQALPDDLATYMYPA